MIEPRVLIYNRIVEIEKEIQQAKKHQYAANSKKFKDIYKQKIERLERLKDINQMIYFQTGDIQ